MGANTLGSIQGGGGTTENKNDEDVPRNARHDDEIINKKQKGPWKIVMQNMEGLVSEKSIEKVKLLNEYTQIDNIILMNLTETWLDNTVEDVVEIEGYNLFRGDRNGKIRGGTAIYLHDKIEANKICEMSYEKCEMVAIMIPENQILNYHQALESLSLSV